MEKRKRGQQKASFQGHVPEASYINSADVSLARAWSHGGPGCNGGSVCGFGPSSREAT